MIPDVNALTWQSLYEYIERRIVGLQNALKMIQQDVRAVDLANSTTSLEHQLELLRWYLPLVTEMQNREDMQVICPIMSLEIIRLRCRSAQANSPDFAWILPVANGRYSLKQRRSGESEQVELIEGGLSQIVEIVGKLVKAICVQGSQ